MHSYDVFGGTLRAPFDFPELEEGVGTPSWIVRRSEAAPAPDPGRPIGEDTVYGEVRVRCYRGSAGHRLAYDDTGRFDVSLGREVTWFPPSGATPGILDAVRADILGRVLALALHQQGILCLHASAVSVRGQGIALLAPKGHGKSTLATALVRGGARLLSDDTVPVTADLPPRLRPGVHQLRLWRDSATELVRERAEGASSARKVVLDHMDAATVEGAVVPFAAAYVLDPAPREESQVVVREPMGEIQSTLALIEHAKLGPLLGGMDAATMFEQAAVIARSVPVWTLRVARDLGRVAQAAAQVRSWHGG